MKTKQCSNCREIKDINLFHWKKKPIKKSAQCGECLNIYKKKHYKKNKRVYKDKAVKNNLKYIYIV